MSVGIIRNVSYKLFFNTVLSMDIVLLVGRILFGGFFIMGGAMHFMKLKDMTEYARTKGAPMPKLSVMGTGMVIMFAGLAVVFGVYQSISLLVISAFLLVITPIMHAYWKVADPNMKMMEMQMFLKNMALLGASLALYVFSSEWPISLLSL